MNVSLRLARSVRRLLPLTAAFALAAAASSPATGGVGTWTTHGPDGASVGAVAVDPANPATVYAGTGGGVFKSTNGGASWSAANSGLGSTGVAALAIDPSSTTTLYAAGGEQGGVFKSTNGGASWTAINSGLSATSTRALAIDPSTPATLYVGTELGVFKSINGGESWIPVNAGLSTFILALVIDPSAPATLYAASRGVFKSTDGGANWTPTGFVSSDGVLALAIDPAAPSNIYAGTQNEISDYDNGDIFRSTDGGATWTGTHVNQNVFALAVSPSRPTVVYASVGSGFFRANDGANFTYVSDLGAFTLVVDPSRPGTLYAGTGVGVFKSLNDGVGWTAENSGLTGASVYAVATDPSLPATVYAGTYGARVSKSADGGASWTAIDAGLTGVYVSSLAIDPSAPSTLYAGTEASGAFKSTDGGARWTAINAGLTSIYVNALVIDPASPATLYAGADDAGVFKSTNGGESWVAVNGGLTALRIVALRIDPSATATLYAGTDGGLFKSTDGGASWSPSLVGPFFYSLAVDPSASGTIYAGAWGGIFKSGDGGASWAALGTSLTNRTISALAVDPSNRERLFAGTLEGGVFESTDAGSTWTAINTGLRNPMVRALAIGGSPSKIFAGTDGGAYELDLGAPEPCVATDSRLCLVGNRYAVELLAARPGEIANTRGTARSLSDRSGYFALPFATGDPTLPEVVVKMLADGALGSSGAPVFYASLTTLPYLLTVSDTLTGERRTYGSSLDTPMCGGVDIPSQARAAALAPREAPKDGTPALSLLGGRFSVTLEARRPGSASSIHGVAMSSGDRFGFFSLPEVTGDSRFPEIAVKMVDARAFGGHFWFFYAGLTSLDYTLTVTDSTTGAVQTYESATPFCGDADTRAFPVAPGTWDYATSSGGTREDR
jgi:photosystem II stability/assembly factor-like uncharacterized protein